MCLCGWHGFGRERGILRIKILKMAPTPSPSLKKKKKKISEYMRVQIISFHKLNCWHKISPTLLLSPLAVFCWLEDSSLHFTLVGGLAYQWFVMSEIMCVGPPLKMSMSTEKIHENSLLVSNSAHISFYKVRPERSTVEKHKKTGMTRY